MKIGRNTLFVKKSKKEIPGDSVSDSEGMAAA
jgi:hypothetical protein